MIENIKKFGLNEYESKAYNALLSSGGNSAVLVSKLTGIPRARVYDVLFSLEQKGFVLKSASKPVEFSAVRPMAAFETIAEQKKIELEKNLGELALVAESVEGAIGSGTDFGEESVWVLGAPGSPNVPGSKTSASASRKSIYSFIANELEKCNSTVLFSSTKGGLERKNSAFIKQFEALKQKGVDVLLRESASSRFVVFDKNSVLLFLNPEEKVPSERAVFIRSPFVANHFFNLNK